MIIYLSGPIGQGEEVEKNRVIFDNYEKRLEFDDYIVVNPFQNEFLADDRKKLMRADIKDMLDCDAIAMLPGWEESKGARQELYNAIACDMKVFDAETMQAMEIEYNLYFTIKNKLV